MTRLEILERVAEAAKMVSLEWPPHPASMSFHLGMDALKEALRELDSVGTVDVDRKAQIEAAADEARKNFAWDGVINKLRTGYYAYYLGFKRGAQFADANPKPEPQSESDAGESLRAVIADGVKIIDRQAKQITELKSKLEATSTALIRARAQIADAKVGPLQINEKSTPPAARVEGLLRAAKAACEYGKPKFYEGEIPIAEKSLVSLLRDLQEAVEAFEEQDEVKCDFDKALEDVNEDYSKASKKRGW